MKREEAPCECGDDDADGCIYVTLGYIYCRPCGVHHRGEECAVDSETGRSIHAWVYPREVCTDRTCCE